LNLLKFILKRLASGVLVILGVVVFIFLLFNVLPVNSARMTLGQRADTASVQAIEREFRLNQPWYKRLYFYFNDLSPVSAHKLNDENHPTYLAPNQAHFVKLFTVGEKTIVLKKPDLGRSFQSRRKVSEVLSEKVFATAILALFAMLIASVIGIVIGVFAALRQYSFWDNFILTSSVIGISQPAFFSAFLIAIIFGYYLSALTGLNHQGSLVVLNDYGDEVIVWKNLILPVIALGIRPVGIIAQLTRASMLDVLSQDYVRTARAKGLSYYKVVFKHALRNALNPVITSISGWLAALLTGAYFIETVFNYDGLGLQTVNSLKNFDFPVVMGGVLFVAVVFVIVNIFTDILYSLLDPRVVIKG
jgi:ABC-type dipeptide/oligopeptide/nickel transport system permease component